MAEQSILWDESKSKAQMKVNAFFEQFRLHNRVQVELLKSFIQTRLCVLFVSICTIC